MAFSIARADILVSVGVRRRNGKMSVNLSLFVLLYNTNFMNKLTVYSIICYNLKKFIDLPIFFQSTKSPHLPLRGKVGQLRRRKRVLCWSIYIITVVYGGEYAQSRHKVCRCRGDFLGTNVTILVYMRCHLSL